MRLALLVLVACSNSAAPPPRAGSDAAPPPAGSDAAPPPAATTTITFRPAPVGSRWARHQHTESDLPGSSGAAHDDATVDETIEILAVASDQVTREKVTFTKVTGSSGAKIEGKTYVLALVGNEVTVTREDGGAVSPEDAREVERWNGDLRFGDPVEKLISGKPLAPGQVLAMDPADLRQLGVDPASLTCTFEGETGGVARFALDYSGTSGNGHDVTASITLTGEGQVDVGAGRILGGEGRGSLTVTLSPGGATLASGTIAASMTTTPL